MAVITDVISPPVVEWELTDRKANETRKFYQSELTIEGEVALFTLVTRTLAELGEEGFPLSEIGNLQLPDGSLDVTKASRLASDAGPKFPGIAGKAAAIMFGYFPTDEAGRADPEFDTAAHFLLKALTISRFMDIVQSFTAQNDIERLARPFVSALKRGVELGIWAERAQQAQTPTTSTLPGSSTNLPKQASATGRRKGGG